MHSLKVWQEWSIFIAAMIVSSIPERCVTSNTRYMAPSPNCWGEKSLVSDHGMRAIMSTPAWPPWLPWFRLYGGRSDHSYVNQFVKNKTQTVIAASSRDHAGSVKI